jgi:hypothetical protein
VKTSVDTLLGGVVAESQQAVWGVSKAEVLDGGADGLVATADNAAFAEEGIFVP